MAPAKRSAAAEIKAKTHRLPDGTQAYCFRTLMENLSTIARNPCRAPSGGEGAPTFQIVTKPLRRLHESLRSHRDAIVALGEHRPAVGRIEALNNNWETLVRRARGYRDHPYLLLKLRFMVVNPIRYRDGVRRFLALGLPVPTPTPALP